MDTVLPLRVGTWDSPYRPVGQPYSGHWVPAVMVVGRLLPPAFPGCQCCAYWVPRAVCWSPAQLEGRHPGHEVVSRPPLWWGLEAAVRPLSRLAATEGHGGGTCPWVLWSPALHTATVCSASCRVGPCREILRCSHRVWVVPAETQHGRSPVKGLPCAVCHQGLVDSLSDTPRRPHVRHWPRLDPSWGGLHCGLRGPACARLAVTLRLVLGHPAARVASEDIVCDTEPCTLGSLPKPQPLQRPSLALAPA